VFFFLDSLQLLSATFLILRKTETVMIKTSNGLQVKYPLLLPHFMKLEFSRQPVEKFSHTKISEKSVQWEPSCSELTDGRTDVSKLVFAFRNVNAPKNNSVGIKHRVRLGRLFSEYRVLFL